MATRDLTTLSFVKGWLQLKASETTDDGFLQHQVSAASRAIESRLNRAILRDTYTETRNGNGVSAMRLINTPIKTVSAVTINNTAVTVRTVPTASGFTWDDINLYVPGWCFAKGVQNIVVTYEAGFDAVPADLEDCVAQVIAWKYRNRDRIGVNSKVLAGETNSYFAGLSKDLLEAIDQYKRVYAP